MKNNKLQDIAWLEPWEPTSQDSGSRAENELQREIIAGHPLHNLKIQAIARRADRDDYLFFLPEHESSLAVVQLTFKKETTVNFPRTTFYDSFDEWIEKVYEGGSHRIYGRMS